MEVSDGYDKERPNSEPEVLLLENLGTEHYRLNFLVDTGDENIKKEMKISLQTGEISAFLYDVLLKQYKNPNNPETLKSLNALCVQPVFCLYAESAEIFSNHGMFRDYLRRFDVRDTLIKLFKVLDAKPKVCDPYMDEELAAFPYVNGGLFRDETIEIPPFADELKMLLLKKPARILTGQPSVPLSSARFLRAV